MWAVATGIPTLHRGNSADARVLSSWILMMAKRLSSKGRIAPKCRAWFYTSSTFCESSIPINGDNSEPKSLAPRCFTAVMKRAVGKV